MTLRSISQPTFKEKRDNTPEGTRLCLMCEKYKPLTDFSDKKLEQPSNYCKTCFTPIIKEKTSKTIKKRKYNSPSGQSYCFGCETYKPIEQFAKNKRRANGIHTHCKSCVKISNAINRESNMLNSKSRRYGVTKEKYQTMLDDQDGVCAICGKPESRLSKGVISTLSVDHDHDTGEVRGLLCSKCNQGLGFFGDSAENLSNAIDYLMKMNR
jgi:hypothetical protein